MEILLFTQPGCGNCGPLREALTGFELDFIEHDVTTVEGLMEFAYCNQGNDKTPLLVVDDLPIVGVENQLNWAKNAKS